MKEKLLLLFLGFLYSSLIYAESKVYNVTSNPKRTNCTRYVENYTDQLPFFIDGGPHFLDSWKETSLDGLSDGPYENTHWYRLRLYSDIQQSKILFFNYILVPRMRIWVKNENDVIKEYELGSNSSYYQDSDQPLIRGYDLKLDFKAGEEIEIFFFKNGYGWPTHTDLFLCDEPTFLKENYEDNKNLIILRVLVLTMLTMGLIVALLSKEKVFLFYALSFYSGALFAETELGSFVKYFDSQWINFSYYLRHFANLFYIISLIYFYKYLLNDVRNGFNKLIKWFTPLWIAYTFITLILFLITKNEEVIAGIFISVVLLSWVSFGWCFYLLFQSFKSKSIYGKIAFGVFLTRLIVIAIFVSLPNLGIIERATFTDYLYYLFIAYESILYFIMLFIKVINIYNDRLRLLFKQKQLENDYSKAVLKGQEFERNRIGRELHDHVGGNLALVNKSDHLGEPEVKKIITSTIKTVREMSHGLITPTFNDVINFEDSIYDLSEKYNSKEVTVFIKFIQWPDSKNVETLNHCYRIIQEMLHNAQKHSQAKSVHIQFFGNENSTGRIIYEDNGVGFDVKHQKGGVGITNINYRVNAIGGEVFIESSQLGTVIRIEKINL
ncbi:sensor histidine kinase [Flammeovirga pacifica]|uniref:histidine kinase n=1 Tax=Flammeovirga pacifica TaxID=915059 RepID=A0A1S1YZE5_FLAPC|nr:ATP-binding protein [Flammeovirga pacifica]OHX66379.1 hypothetical protein NH26_08440 [Flammeovirga pacifica]